MSQRNESTPNLVALIPARSGSKRVKDKNIKPLEGHPAMAYSIAAALSSGVCDEVHVSTDSDDYAAVAEHYGAGVIRRPAALSIATSPDIDWVIHALDTLSARGKDFDALAILRPTSPFRLPSTIARAWRRFSEADGIDSLRAVQKCAEHPCKMWVLRGERLLPLIPFGPEDQPWHSSQYPTLPEVYVQNASLEIAWTDMVRKTRTIAGAALLPFLTEGFEGVDINGPADWHYARYIIEHEDARLPSIRKAPYVDAEPMRVRGAA